jgi:hypothetical protein
MTQRTGEPDRGAGASSSRVAAWLAWTLAGLSVVIFLATFPLYFLARSAPVPTSWDANLDIGGQLGSALFLAFPIVGTLIASRHPRNPIGWIFLADGFLWLLTGFMDYYGIYGLASPGSVPFPVGVAGVNNFLWVPAVGLLGTYAIMLFPDGRLPSRRWRPLAWLSGVIIVVLTVGVAISPEPLQNLGGTRNPFGLELPLWTDAAFFIILPLLPLCMLASVGSLVSRYRRAVGEERQQIKWISFAASVVGVLYLIAMITSFVFPSGAWMAAGSPLWLDLIAYAALGSFTGVPIAVGFAVLKYRLYDIDLLINRAIVYGSLTVLLAAAYAGGVVGLQALLRLVAGQGSTLAVVASTLAIAALFNPLRRRLQGLVDKRFYRKKYDAAKTLAAFSARLREQTDLDALSDGLVEVVRDTVQPAHASLWLRPEATQKEKQASGP